MKALIKILSALSLIARHLTASIVSVVMPLAVITTGYFVLLVAALITNSGVGIPVALPLWLLLSLGLSIAYTTFLLFPSVLMAEMLSPIFGKGQYVVQIPLSMLMLALSIFIVTQLVQDSNALNWIGPKALFVFLLIPLGLYWWTAKTVQFVIAVPVSLFKRLLQPLFS